MPKQVEFNGIIHEFPDDFSDTDIASALGMAAPVETLSTQPQTSLADTAIDALPTIGGAVGSLVGAGKWNPLGMAGAALGGMAGEGFKQTANALRGRLDLVPASIPEQLASIGSAGAVQGGLEGIGRGIVQPLAKGAYGLALRPIKSLRDKYGTKALIDAGFEGRVMPTKGGAAKAMGQMSESKAAQEGMADAFDQSGGQLPSTMSTVRQSIGPLVKRARSQEMATGASEAGRQSVVDAGKRVVKQNPSRMTARQMIDAKHAADQVADPAYTAARRTGVSVPEASEAGIAKGFSKGYRQTLNDSIGPEFAAQGQRTKTLYGLSKAADYAAERPEMLSNIVATGAGALGSGGDNVQQGVTTGLVTRALLAPRTQAAAALSLTPLSLYGTRALDAAAGSPLEQMLREALLSQLTGTAASGQ
jgi:hypothetical protein